MSSTRPAGTRPVVLPRTLRWSPTSPRNTSARAAPSDAPIALLLFARVLEEAGLPAGALHVLTGPSSKIGDLLAGHPDINMVSMTGSSAVGRHIADLAGVKPLHLELGGNAAAVICADAELDHAVAKPVSGAFKSSGQRCDAISRVLVAEAAYDAYVERAVAEARNWPVGDPRAEGVQVGPLVNTSQVQQVARLVADAQERGARVLLGGESAEAYRQPTVLVDVPAHRAAPAHLQSWCSLPDAALPEAPGPAPRGGRRR